MCTVVTPFNVMLQLETGRRAHVPLVRGDERADFGDGFRRTRGVVPRIGCFPVDHHTLWRDRISPTQKIPPRRLRAAQFRVQPADSEIVAAL